MKYFQYKVLCLCSRSDSYVESELNKLGAKGWELVSTRGDYEYLLKREINKKEDLK